MLSRMTTQDPLVQPSHTQPLEDWLVWCLVSIWTICMSPTFDLYARWHTCQLSSLTVTQGNPWAPWDPSYQNRCLFRHTTPIQSMLVHLPLSLCICVEDCPLVSRLALVLPPATSVTLPSLSHHPSGDHLAHQSPCLILTSDLCAWTPFCLTRVIFRIRVPVAIFDHAQLGGLLGYLV